MTTTYKVATNVGTVAVEANSYRKDGDGNLYFYREDAEDPVASFPTNYWFGFYEAQHAKMVE